VLDFEDFRLSLRHGGPSQHLLSSCICFSHVIQLSVIMLLQVDKLTSVVDSDVLKGFIEVF